MNELTLLLADDHEVVRMGLRLLLEQIPNTRILAEAGTADEAVRLCGLYQPALVIMDIRMPPGGSGIDACRIITTRWPATQVIMLTSYADDELIAESIKAGAVGYVLKQGKTGELVRAVEAVRSGAAMLDPAVTRRVLEMMRTGTSARTDPFHDLTDRELDVLRLVAEGKSNAEIAAALMLSDKTVRNHISILLDKLALNNRVEAAAYAIHHDLNHYRRDS